MTRSRSGSFSTLRRATFENLENFGAASRRSNADDVLPQSVTHALADAGYMRHFVGTPYGGANGSFSDLLAACRLLGAVNPSYAWCGSVAASLSRAAGFLPPEARRELWRDSADVIVAGSMSPKGATARRTGDGWQVKGKWPYVSMVDHADWLLLAAKEEDSEAIRVFAVQGEQVVSQPTWSSIGMRATNSNSVTVTDVFIPEHRSIDFNIVKEGGVDSEARIPLQAVNGLFFSAPMLGAAEGALSRWCNLVQEKMGFQNEMYRPSYQDALARSSSEIDAARLLLERITWTADCDDLTPFLIARGQRDSAVAADLLVAATYRLARSGGTSAQLEDEPLQRYFLDVQTAGSHIVLQLPPNAQAFADSFSPKDLFA